MGYDAFVSYSHAADGLLAPRLQQALQRFAKPWWRRRALRVFRDETGLSVNPHLWGSISEALDDSEWFVLLASEEAARSPWVEREVAYWKEHKDPGRILPVVTDGEWVWDATVDDFDWAASTAVPAALAEVFLSEPRHLDLRWARAESQLDLRNSRFGGDVAQLAAAIRGVPKDDLEGEDVRQHRRTLRWAWGAAIALLLLTVLSAGTAVAAVRNADQARRSEDAAIAAQGEADRQAALAVANADEAQANAQEADDQRTNAEQNAARAAQNQTEAEAQQARAEANATEARNNADQAAANATEARNNADRAATNATEAQQNADRANQATDEANANASKARQLATDLQASNADLVASNHNLEQQTRLAISRQLAALAINDIDTDYGRALLQAVAANGVARTAQARESLLRAILAHPEVRLRFRSDMGQTFGVLVSPDGETILVANSANGAEIWDAASGRMRSSTNLGGLVLGGAFGPQDELAIVTQSELVILNTTTGAVRTRIAGGSSAVPAAVAFAADGRAVAVANGTAVDWWDVSDQPQLEMRIPAESVDRVAFSPDGTTLAWAGGDVRSTSRDIFVAQPTGLRLVEQIGADDVVTALAFSTDGTVLQSVVSGDTDDVTFSDVGTGTLIARRTIADGRVVAVSPDQQLMAVRDDGGTVRFESSWTGEQLGRPIVGDTPGIGYGYSYAFTPDATALVMTPPDGSVEVIDLYPVELGQRALFAGYGLGTLSADGTLIAIGDTIMEVATGRVVRTLPAHLSHEGTFSPDGAVFTFVDAGLLLIVDVRGDGVRQTALDDGWEFYGDPPVFSPDGRIVAAVTARFDESITSRLRFWDVATAMPAAPTPPPELGPSGWDRTSSATSDLMVAMAYAPDGTLTIATLGADLILIAPDGQVRTIADVPGYSLRYSRDGRWLASGSTVLAMPAGTPVGRPLSIPEREITHIALDPDEGTIATSASDGTIQLWDLASQAPLGPALTGSVGEVTSLVFAGPGRLVAADSSGTVTTWSLDVPSLARRACARVADELGPLDWKQLVGDAVPYDEPCAAYRQPTAER